jgi:hypothetical protein
MHVEKIEIMPAVTARIRWRIEVPHWHHYRATLSLSLAARLACAVYGADCCCCCIIGGDHDLRTADACPRLGPKTKSILLVWHHSDVEPMRPTPRLAGAGVACIEATMTRCQSECTCLSKMWSKMKSIRMAWHCADVAPRGYLVPTVYHSGPRVVDSFDSGQC